MKIILKQIWRHWNFADRYVTVSSIFFLLSFTYQSSFCHVLSFDANKLVVVVDGQVGVTTLTGLKQVKCLLCPEVDCSHCTYVSSFDLKDASTPLCVLEFFETSTQIKKKRVFSPCLSKKELPYVVDDEFYQSILKRRPMEYLHRGDDGRFILKEEIDSCCQTFLTTSSKLVKLFTKSEIVDCTGTSLKFLIFWLGCTPFIIMRNSFIGNWRLRLLKITKFDGFDHC